MLGLAGAAGAAEGAGDEAGFCVGLYGWMPAPPVLIPPCAPPMGGCGGVGRAELTISIALEAVFHCWALSTGSGALVLFMTICRPGCSQPPMSYSPGTDPLASEETGRCHCNAKSVAPLAAPPYWVASAAPPDSTLTPLGSVSAMCELGPPPPRMTPMFSSPDLYPGMNPSAAKSDSVVK
ncbi:Uncharacterised protein [Mycobacteroides abscessus]|nr:Uncharacterised protein [Mycobacteroides abscessus]